MDPLTLILTALSQEAAKAAIDVLRDADKSLRNLPKQQLAGKPAAGMVFQAHAADPGTVEASLR